MLRQIPASACTAAGSDSGDVKAGQHPSAVNHRPMLASIRGAQEPNRRAGAAPPIAAEATRSGNQGLARGIGGVEFQGADGEGGLIVGEGAPVRRGRGALVGAPHAAVDGADPEDLGVGRMHRNGMDASNDLAFIDVLHLAVRVRPWRLGRPETLTLSLPRGEKN